MNYSIALIALQVTLKIAQLVTKETYFFEFNNQKFFYKLDSVGPSETDPPNGNSTPLQNSPIYLLFGGVGLNAIIKKIDLELMLT